MKKKVWFALLLAFCMCLNGVAIMAAEMTNVVDFSDDLVSFGDNWVYTIGGGTAGTVTTTSNKYFEMLDSGIADIISKSTMTTPYTFSVDTSSASPAKMFLGFFIRGGRSQDFFPFYVHDRNGGFGSSGICVELLSDKIRITIKNQVTTETHASSSSFWECTNLPTGYDITKLTNLKAIDDGTKVQIKVMDVLIATVEYSNPGVFDGDDSYIEGTYYKTALMKDSSGTVVLNETKARIAEEAYIGIGAYYANVQFDNFSITTGTPDPTPTATSTATPTATPTITSPATGDNLAFIVAIVATASVMLVCSQVMLIVKKSKV